MRWWVWALAVRFVVYLVTVQIGYAIVNANVQKDVGLTVTQVATIAATAPRLVDALRYRSPRYGAS